MVSALGPHWFLGTDVAFHTVFTIVTAIVTLVGFRAYRFFKDPKYRMHSTGFFFLSASYLLLGLTNLAIMLELHNAAITLRDVLGLAKLISVGSLLHSLFFLTGLVFLLIVYLQIKERSVQILLFILILFSVLLADRVRSAFYILVAILLLFIIVKLAENYGKKQAISSLLVLLGFIGLFVGEVLLSLMFVGPLLYVAAGSITLISYLLVLASLVVR